MHLMIREVKTPEYLHDSDIRLLSLHQLPNMSVYLHKFNSEMSPYRENDQPRLFYRKQDNALN